MLQGVEMKEIKIGSLVQWIWRDDTISDKTYVGVVTKKWDNGFTVHWILDGVRLDYLYEELDKTMKILYY